MCTYNYTHSPNKRHKTKAKRLNFDVECDERNCGNQIVGSSVDDGFPTQPAPSSIAGAGHGLFVTSVVARRTTLGYFGGELLCAECVRKRKLGRKDNQFSLVECDYTYNDDGEQVLWYLHRTGFDEVDGIMWYANSVRLKGNGQKNCSIVVEGIDGDGSVYACITTDNELADETECLLDYLK